MDLSPLSNDFVTNIIDNGENAGQGYIIFLTIQIIRSSGVLRHKI